MSWVLLLFGSLAGGILSALSWRDRENVLMRFIAFVVPFGFGVAFWYFKIKSGNLLADFSAVSADGIASQIVTMIITSLIVTAVSKGIGFLIVKYFDEK